MLKWNEFFRRLMVITFIGATVQFAEAAEHLSIYKLVGNSEKYNQSRVTTVGVLGKSESGHYLLYFDESSFKNLIRVNALIVGGGAHPLDAIDLDEFLGKYVLVDGVFDKSSLKGLFSGTIELEAAVRTFPIVLQPVESNPK